MVIRNSVALSGASRINIMTLSPEQNTLFSLLKTSLCFSNREAFSVIPEDIDWDSLVNLAARQGVLCVARDGLVQMPGISRKLLIRWELSVQKLEARNRKQREVIKELVALFKENGIEMLLLKGIGLSELYPDPYHRECGDIDFFLFGDYEKGNKVIEDLGIEVEKEGSKHSKFYFKGVPVENHKTFLNVECTQTDKNLEKYLHETLTEQGYDTIIIEGVQVRIPVPDFTAIFLTRHNITHFLASGLVLRHFCDMALFFEKNRERIDFARFEKVMRENGQYKLICSFLAIARNYLGFSKVSLTECSEKGQHTTGLAKRILEDTLYNKYRSADKNEIETMWIPRRKLFGLKFFFSSKWKYDSIERGLFCKSLFFRVSQNFQDINWK